METGYVITIWGTLWKLAMLSQYGEHYGNYVTEHYGNWICYHNMGTLWKPAMFQITMETGCVPEQNIKNWQKMCLAHSCCCGNIFLNDTLQMMLTNSTYIHLQDLCVLLFDDFRMCFGRF
jgi:hypothetical protein